MPETASLQLAKQLIAQASITPDDHSCQEIIAERLRAIGFTVERKTCGRGAATARLWCALPGIQTLSRPARPKPGHPRRFSPPNATASSTGAVQPI